MLPHEVAQFLKGASVEDITVALIAARQAGETDMRERAAMVADANLRYDTGKIIRSLPIRSGALQDN